MSKEDSNTRIIANYFGISFIIIGIVLVISAFYVGFGLSSRYNITTSFLEFGSRIPQARGLTGVFFIIVGLFIKKDADSKCPKKQAQFNLKNYNHYK